MTCSRCGTRACTCGTCCGSSVVSTVPFYQQAEVCEEDHTQKIYQAQFFFSICPSSSWNIPLCGQTAVLSVPGVQGATVGSNIWNPAYGYFEIISIDVQSSTIGIVNNCEEGNASPGAQIPACTCFIVTTPPNAADILNGQVCLALDFTAPEEGETVLITVTSIGSMSVGDSIQIGTGRYVITEINSATTITIRNDGLGILPGTPVIAFDANGNYQYCFIIISNCCSRIEDEFGGDLTPCSDFQNVVTGDNAFNEITPQILGDGDVVVSTVASLTFNNHSTCREMKVMLQFEYYAQWATVITGSLPTFPVRYDPEVQINGGGYNSLIVTLAGDGLISELPVGIVSGPSDNLSNSNVYTIAPSTAVTYDFRITLTLGGDPGDSAGLAGFLGKLSGIGVAV